MTRVFTGYAVIHCAPIHTLLCECVVMPETSFITKEWENARNAPHYTMHFVVPSHEQGRGFNL